MTRWSPSASRGAEGARQKAYPEKPITGQTIRRSLRARQAYSDRAEPGVVYDPALRRRVAEEEGMGIE